MLLDELKAEYQKLPKKKQEVIRGMLSQMQTLKKIQEEKPELWPDEVGSPSNPYRE